MRRIFNNIIGRLAALAAAAALTASPLAVSAQPTVAYAQSPGPTIKGTVATIPGKYQIEVRDTRGYLDNVSLHDGTIINPTGIRLQPGFRVTIYGRPNGSTFIADEIDTPYRRVQSQVGYYPYPAYEPFFPGYLWYEPSSVVIIGRGPR
jgi:hypothetical protein